MEKQSCLNSSRKIGQMRGRKKKSFKKLVCWKTAPKVGEKVLKNSQ